MEEASFMEEMRWRDPRTTGVVLVFVPYLYHVPGTLRAVPNPVAWVEYWYTVLRTVHLNFKPRHNAVTHIFNGYGYEYTLKRLMCQVRVPGTHPPDGG